MLAADCQEPLEGRKATYLFNFHLRITIRAKDLSATLVSRHLSVTLVCVMQRMSCCLPCTIDVGQG